MSNLIKEKIAGLAEQRNAVILVHNYQLPEVQDIADFGGDSLGLSIRASETKAEVIVFCGVHFMAETAAILNPRATVLLPHKDAGCPMADMITADQLREMKASHPQAMVVCYVNSTAEVKAESDYCCTSANAVAVVRSLPASGEIIFVPDRYLGQFVSEQTGRKMVLWPGYCPTHVQIAEQDVMRERRAHPEAVVMVHPECTGPVRAGADEVLSTGGMSRFARTSEATEFIVGTEIGMVYRLARDNPDKRFYPVKDNAVCPNMKRIRLENVLWSLQDMQHVVTVADPIRRRAQRAIDRMISVTV